MALTAHPYETSYFQGRLAHTDAPIRLAGEPGPRSSELKVVVTMPAYHAGRTLERTLADLPLNLAEHVIVVDDASTDDTVEVAHGLGLTVYAHETNRGYGGNQKTCYTQALAAGADVVVMLHPDYQYNPRAVPLLLGPILSGDADMTFGSRFAGMSDPRAGGMPWYRYAGNRVTTTIQNQLLGTRFTELHSGMRAYSRACLLSMPFLSYSDGFDFDAQFLCDAIGGGFHVIEVPIPTRYTTESSSIAVGPSLRYVGRSVQNAARARLKYGRRGKRAALRRGEQPTAERVGGGTPPSPERTPVAADTIPLRLECPACGLIGHDTVLDPTTVAAPRPCDFASTRARPGIHDGVARCRGCGVMRSQLTLSREELLSLYEGCTDENYLREEASRRLCFSEILDSVESYPIGGRTLLDLGAHVGLMCDVARSRGYDVTGVDPSIWAVEQARRRFGLDITPGAVETFDPATPSHVVTMLDVVEHLHDPVAALRRVRHMVDEDGLLVITTVDATSLHARLRGSDWPWFFRPHLWHYTPASLRHHLDEAGFRAVEWRKAPVRFRLSYTIDRASRPGGVLAAMAERMDRAFDPTVRLDWLGDSVLVVARPR